MFGFNRKKKRRENLRREPFPPDWWAILERNCPHYHYLPPEDQIELQGHIQVLLAEKNFEGCGGLEMTDEIRVTIAAYACLLLLHRDTDYYPRLYSILVYPHPFVAETTKKAVGRWVIKSEEVRVGESWNTGAVILAWDDIQYSVRYPGDGHNVILHEFAHQLDSENGAPNGFPMIEDDEVADEWSEAFTEAYDRFQDQLEDGHGTLLDEYGAKSPSEFFAVVTEAFFEIPRELQEEYPELYNALSQYFQQDPAASFPKMEYDGQTG